MINTRCSLLLLTPYSQDKKYNDAALLSKQLLQSPDVPKGYEMRLLLDLLPVLEGKNKLLAYWIVMVAYLLALQLPMML